MKSGRMPGSALSILEESRATKEEKVGGWKTRGERRSVIREG